MSDIKKLRELLKLTQAEFAERLNTTERTIQNWEGGKATPTKPKLKLLKQMAAQFPEATFAMFGAVDSPNAGYGNGISSADLKRILDEIDAQRKSFMEEISRQHDEIKEKEKELARRDAQIEKRDTQIDELISLLKAKL